MEAYKRIALVTGGNKGIGLEICRQLASNGANVILTARDEKRGKEAVEKLTNDYGLTNIIFYQLDVTDLSSIASSVGFVKSQFGKLDILVNNAGIVGTELSKPIAEKINNGGDSSFILEFQAKLQAGDLKYIAAMTIEPYEKSKECIDINYYGTKAMCEAFIPLLQLSKSPRIVNVSSYFGKLEFIPGEDIRKEIGNINTFTEVRLEELLGTFLEDFKAGRLKESGWPDMSSAYTVSKVAVCAYTRILAKKYPKIIANSVHPGYVNTDINFNTGVISTEEGAKGPVMLALLPDGSSSGQFYDQTELSSFE